MKNWRQLLVIMLVSTIPALAHAERIKDITSISGVRSNQLIGYGLYGRVIGGVDHRLPDGAKRIGQ